MQAGVQQEVMPVFSFSAFCRGRQTPASEFTHWTLTEAQVLALVDENFNKRKPGYREGVVLVPVPPEGFFSPVVILKEGDKLIGEYKARRPGESPRKSVHAINNASKTPAVGVDVILYHRDVLAEDEDAMDLTGAEWEIVSVNARVTEEEQPIAPMTLLANHFHLDGGTKTGMSPAEFERALEASVLYWKDKALLACSEVF